MDLRQLECFLAVAEELHFGRAADQLQVAQPSVSQQIRRLERSLGVVLFARTSRRVQLTPAGQRLLPEARSIMVAIERATDIARGRDRQVLRLGTVDVLGDRLDQLLDLFARRMANIRVELVQLHARERIRRVISSDLDAALVRSASPSPGIRLLRLWEERPIVALPAAHPLAAKPRLRLEELAAMPVRLTPRRFNTTLYDKIVVACRDAGFEPIIGPPLNHIQDTLADIGTNAPSWTILYEAAARLVATRRVALRPVDNARLSITTSLATRERPDPMVNALISACGELTEAHPLGSPSL